MESRNRFRYGFIAIFVIYLIAILLSLKAFAEIHSVPTIELGVSVEILNSESVCNKAIVIATDALEMTPEAAHDFLSLDGSLDIHRCIQLIFTRTTNMEDGFRVHEVSSEVGEAMIGVDP